MLTISTANLRVGWFSGTGGGSRQYIGPGGYFSTEGFPPEAYTIIPDYLMNPEGSLAEQVLAEGVVGELPVDTAPPATALDTSKLLGSMALAALPAEMMMPVEYTFGIARVTAGDQQGALPLVFIPPVAAAIGTAGFRMAWWIAGMLGISGILGISGWVLDMFKFGRVFLYWKGEAIGSLAPPEAFLWYSELNGNQQRFARMRMEAADKGGANQRAPVRAPGEQDFRSKSFLERLNPFHGGDSFWQRIWPFT